MSKNIVVLSTYVDNSIREVLLHDNIQVFNTVDQINDYVKTNALRPDVMYITRDVLGEATNVKLAVILNTVKSPFFRANDVVYVTEIPHKELNSVNFMIEHEDLKNWTIIKGSLNREFITSLISGTLRDDEVTPTRKAIVRVPMAEYVKRKTKAGNPEEHYDVEEDELSKVQISESEIGVETVPKDTSCILKIITGLRTKERNVFAFLLAQYLAHGNKVVIIEKDTDYLPLMNMSGVLDVPVAVFQMSMLFDDPAMFFRKIKAETSRLILITDNERNNYDSAFVESVMYNNLINDINYLIVQKELQEIPTATKYIAVVPNSIPDIIETSEKVANVAKDSIFVVMSTGTLKSLTVQDIRQVKLIMQDIMQEETVNVEIVEALSVKLGGGMHDMRMYAN